MFKFHKLILLACLILSISASNCTQVTISGCVTYNTTSPNSTCPCKVCSIGNYLTSNFSCVSCNVIAFLCYSCNSTTCTACDATTYLNASNACPFCSSRTPNCQLCNSTTCTTCNYNAYLNASYGCPLCTIYDSNCLSCNNITCTGCNSIFYLNSSQKCVACTTITSLCDSCNNNSCLGCNAGYGLNSTSNCISCSTNLTYCYDCVYTSACISCINSLYVIVSGHCSLCSSVLTGCHQCSCTSSNCCSSCVNSSYYWNSNNCFLCNSSLVGCLTCSSNSSCSLCNNSYALITTNNCSLCSIAINFCLTCFNTTLCTGCINDSYYLSTICYSCNYSLVGCQHCSSNLNCTSCNNTYALMNNTCSICSSLINFCSTCSNSTQCDSCVSSLYYLSSGHCFICNNSLIGCITCSSDLNCTQCNNTYALTSNNTCQFCNLTINFCATCSSSSVCTNCVNRFYYLQTICYPCNTSLLGCMSCTSDTTCLQCWNNTYLLVGINCVPCSVIIGPQCTKCISTTICDQCANTQYTLIRSSTFPYPSSCQPCVSIMKGCSNCQNTTSCLKCGVGRPKEVTHKMKPQFQQMIRKLIFILKLYFLYFNKINRFVTLHPVEGGCTQVKGCLQVDSTLNFDVNCLRCNPSTFFQIPVNNTCVCKEGWIIGEICGNMIGCSSLVMTNLSTTTCMTCSGNKGFVLSNGICICRQYYYLSGSICNEICGDGHLFVLPCDDGNLIDFDGCSSTCSIQTALGYICKITTNFPASQCMYKGKITLTLDQISHVADSNSVQISFTINSYTSIINKMNFADPSITNFTAPSCHLESYSIINEKLIFYVSFNASLDNQTASLFISFDPNYIISPNFTKNFSMTPTDGGVLWFNPSLGDSQYLRKLIQVMSYASLGAFAVGSFAYKMIGVQTIHTYQIILLLIVNSNSYPYIFAQLSNFALSYGQLFQIPSLISQDLISQQMFARLGYSQSPLTGYFIWAIFQCIIMATYISLRIFFLRTKNNIQIQSLQVKEDQLEINDFLRLKKDILKQKSDSQIMKQTKGSPSNSFQQKKHCLNVQLKIVNCIYNWLLFPLFVGFMFHFLNTLIVEEMFASSNTSNLIFKVTTLLIVLIAIGRYMIFANEFKVVFIQTCPTNNQLLKHECHRSYIPLYLLNQILLFLVTTTGLLRVNSIKFEISACIILINLVYICLKRPYLQHIHNFYILLNQLTLSFAVGWILWEKYSSIPYEIEKLLLQLLLGLMGAVIFFSLARTIFTIWKLYFSQKTTE